MRFDPQGNPKTDGIGNYGEVIVMQAPTAGNSRFRVDLTTDFEIMNNLG
jgi:hypothetical protein